MTIINLLNIPRYKVCDVRLTSCLLQLKYIENIELNQNNRYQVALPGSSRPWLMSSQLNLNIVHLHMVH